MSKYESLWCYNDREINETLAAEDPFDVQLKYVL